MKYFTIFLCLISNILCAQPKLHAFVIRDTDPDIGAETDFPRMQAVMANIAEISGLTLHLQTFEKNHIAYEPFKDALQSLKCSPEDMIWFYYTGHGFHASDQGSGQFSAFLLNQAQVKIPLEWVHAKLAAHHPRLLLTMFDCCNYDFEPVKDKILLQEPLEKNYIALFSQAAGEIKVSSNRAGYQASSWGDSKSGGVFTSAFLNALDEVTAGQYSACSWENVLLRAKKRTQTIAEQHGKIQIPHYEVNIRQY